MELPENFKPDAAFLQLYDELEYTYNNFFITGKAGTGKSTLLQYFKEKTNKKFIVLASTGVAANNVGGQTIHSFFGFPLRRLRQSDLEYIHLSEKSPKKKIIYELDTLLIDEVSMVNADILDGIDAQLRLILGEFEKPFGGIQVVLIGDAYQLAPVVTEDRQEGGGYYERPLQYKTPYFFSAKAFKTGGFIIRELQNIYRQKDRKFTDALNKIRMGIADEEVLQIINARAEDRDEITDAMEADDCIMLATTNNIANAENARRLQQLPGKTFRYEGKKSKNFPDSMLRVEQVLEVKEGAHIIMMKNDHSGRWVNGSLGVIESIERGDLEDIVERKQKKKVARLEAWEKLSKQHPNASEEELETLVEEQIQEDTDKKYFKAGKFDAAQFEADYAGPCLWVRLYNEGTLERIVPHYFENINYSFDGGGNISPKVVGTFKQFPLRLGWAITVHKSQGLTFDKMVLNPGWGMFAEGQLYVALSRCRTLQGLYLTRPIQASDIFYPESVIGFFNWFNNSSHNQSIELARVPRRPPKPAKLKKEVIQKIKEQKQKANAVEVQAKNLAQGLAKNQGLRWDKAQIIQVRELFFEGKSIREIADIVGRSYGAIASKLVLEKLILSYNVEQRIAIRYIDELAEQAFSSEDKEYTTGTWQEEEIATLQTLFEANAELDEISLHLNRSALSIFLRLIDLGQIKLPEEESIYEYYPFQVLLNQ